MIKAPMKAMGARMYFTCNFPDSGASLFHPEEAHALCSAVNRNRGHKPFTEVSIMFKFIFLLFIASPSFASDWSSADTKREAVYLVLHTVDYAQTREIARNPDKWHEQNSILGSHPSSSQVDQYFVATAALQFAVAYYLPAKYRAPFQYVTIGIEGGAVAHNFSIGIRVRF
jgi:hypothetical protein